MPKIALSKIFRVWQLPTVGSLKWGDNISSRPPTKICSNPTQGCVFFIGNPLKPFILLQMNCDIVIPCKETEQERQIPSDNDSASLYFGLMTPPRTDKVSYHHSSVAITVEGPIWLLWILQQWHWGSHTFCSAQGPPGAKRRFPTLLWAYNQNWLHLISLLCDHHREVKRVLDLDIWFRSLSHTSSIDWCSCLIRGTHWYWRCPRIFHATSSWCSERTWGSLTRTVSYLPVPCRGLRSVTLQKIFVFRELHWDHPPVVQWLSLRKWTVRVFNSTY